MSEKDLKAKHKGSHAELKAAAWLLEQGYEVFKNVSPHGEIDLIAIKGNEIRKIDVKRTYRGGSPIEGVEYLTMMANGSFRFMGQRKPRGVRTRDLTPREIVLRQLESKGIDARG